jgi:hypothetical protein
MVIVQFINEKVQNIKSKEERRKQGRKVEIKLGSK